MCPSSQRCLALRVASKNVCSGALFGKQLQANTRIKFALMGMMTFGRRTKTTTVLQGVSLLYTSTMNELAKRLNIFNQCRGLGVPLWSCPPVFFSGMGLC